MKVLIVGAGFSGCIAAAAAVDAGHTVDVVESTWCPGGVMRDHVVGTDIWFRNCHYYDPGVIWLDQFMTDAGVHFLEFPHLYGSWNDLFGSTCVSHDFGQVVAPEFFAEERNANFSFTSVVERFGTYPSLLASALAQFGCRWGELANLHHENTKFMQVDKVFLKDDASKVSALKKSSLILDEIYGLPRDLLSPPLAIEKAALPRNGWSRAFGNIYDFLRLRGVDFHFGHQAKPKVRSGKLDVFCQGSLVAADVVIWCANPHPLARALDVGRLNSPVSNMTNVLFSVIGDLPKNPRYWQIFSQTSPIVRLFHYSLLGSPRVTIETFSDGFDLDLILGHLNQILRDISLNVTLNLVAVIPDRRYALVTVDDYHKFLILNQAAKNASVITGGWQMYGRQKRVNFILESMTDLGLL